MSDVVSKPLSANGRTTEPPPAVLLYDNFLASKRLETSALGFDVEKSAINPMLFPFQRAIVEWALRRGRAAIFADCGMGKTPIQLEWARHVCEHTGGDVLILAPLAVAQQTRREGEKFSIDVTVCRSQSDVRPGINVTNYEMLDHFDPSAFSGVVLDESGILKAYMGSTKRKLITAFARTPYRLCCTATPAPNDHTELGNHSEFLGVMPSNEMLSRWFINDTKRTGVYRLKRHAEADYWDWVASWGIALRRPSDLGYSNDGFILPELCEHHLSVEVDLIDGRGEQLFRTPTMSATTLHQEMRRTAHDRAGAVADLVNDSPETWLIWSHTNYEADEIVRQIPSSVDIRGSESLDVKERKIARFLDGGIQVLSSKPSICGWGLNFQHCHCLVFVGLSYSFEEMYQAIRRSWRFGQTHQVDVFFVSATTESVIQSRLREKIAAHEEMLDAMRAATAKQMGRGDMTLLNYDPQAPLRLPMWLRSVSA